MTENNPHPAGDAARTSGFLDPDTRAVAAVALAVVGLLAPNVFQTALQVLVGGAMGAGDPQVYFLAAAVGAAVPLGLALWLAREPARSGAPGWTTVLARAALVLSLVGLAGAALQLLGALVHGGY